MKQTTKDVEHTHLHTRANGVQVYVTTEHLRRINNRKRQYHRGSLPPNYPMPAIPYHSFVSDVASITIWPGVIQYRISDQPYTGFGKVITIEHGVRCEARYDDFD